jgi:hypothetical protein
MSQYTCVLCIVIFHFFQNRNKMNNKINCAKRNKEQNVYIKNQLKKSTGSTGSTLYLPKSNYRSPMDRHYTCRKPAKEFNGSTL